jgi:hypothetical protein
VYYSPLAKCQCTDEDDILEEHSCLCGFWSVAKVVTNNAVSNGQVSGGVQEIVSDEKLR